MTGNCVGVEPRYMGISPIYAIPKILEHVGLSKEDVDVYEVGSTRRICIGNFDELTLYRSMKRLPPSLPTA